MIRGYERDPEALPRSLWAASAPALIPLAPLGGSLATDVAIIGAGYTGLSCALHLRERGIDCVVLEAREPGWGASGRNNGQVIPGLKLDPDDLERLHGERGKAMVRASGDAPRLVFDLIRHHDIDCEAVNNGWIQPVHSTRALHGAERRMRQWERRGAPVEWLPDAEIERILGTRWYVAAWRDRRGGSVNPLAYARGLAKAASAASAAIYSQTPVDTLERAADGWSLKTSRGTVTARQVVIATNAYSDDLLTPLGSTVVPIRSAQVATAPLDERLAATILPGGECASDTRRLLTSFRITPQRHLVMGGSGATGGSYEPPMVSALHRTAAEMFPQLGDIPWQYSWSGVWAITTDHLPHLHEPAPGLYAALGCNGRGIALATLWGKLLAQRIAGAKADELPFPVTVPKRLILGPLHRWGIPLVIATRRLLDAYDRKDRGESRQ